MLSITESEAEVVIDLQLSACDWQLDPRQPGRNVHKQQPRTPEQKTALGGKQPDYVLYAHGDSNKPSLVIEAKKPGVSMENALGQGKEYARRLGAPLVVVSDGWRVKTWHMVCNSPLFLDGHEVDELFSPEMTRAFISHNSFSTFLKDVGIEREELVGKFKKANNILKAEGFSAGIERFSEFANLMFLKLKIEGGGGEIAGFSWSDIEGKHGNAQLKAVKQMFAELKRKHSTLFEQTKIRQPRNLERLIEILSSFRLSSVKDDIKGVAFEHFIHSYTRGTKNDLGQYFTPRHIVRMMVHFLRPQIGETIYDPFCGTGGMLIECFRYLKQHMEDKRRNVDFLKRKALWGRDNSNAARIAMMNMIMFGDGHTNIEQGDSYSMLGKTRREYDIVITNIPFSQQTDFTSEYPVIPSGDKNGDSIGVQHCLESLKRTETARAGIIVPIGFLYKPQLEQERKHIFKNWEVERVVELSPKCFQPYTEQQTAIIVVKHGKTGADFPYFQVRQDGYSQDGYRVPLPGENDIDRVMDDVGRRLQPAVKEMKSLNVIVRKGEIPLGKIATVTAGAGNISPKTKIADVTGGKYPVLMVADLARNHIDYALDESVYKLTDQAVKNKNPHLFPEDTILLPITGKAALKNHRALLDMPAYATSTLAGIEAEEDHIHPYVLFHFFLGFDIEAVVYDLGYPGVTIDKLKGIPIPNYSSNRESDIIKRVSEVVELSRELKRKRRALETREL